MVRTTRPADSDAFVHFTVPVETRKFSASTSTRAMSTQWPAVSTSRGATTVPVQVTTSCPFGTR
jgi:hypothetical protein